MEKRILLAFDYSENSARAVQFVARSFTREHRVTLFSVIPDTAAVCDLNNPGLTPYFVSQKEAFCGLENEKGRLVREAIETARVVLVQAGFPEDRVEVRIQGQKEGVARDIAAEARANDYGTVVMGRRGLSGVKEFFLGSVSQKVVQLLRDMTVVLVS